MHKKYMNSHNSAFFQQYLLKIDLGHNASIRKQKNSEKGAWLLKISKDNEKGTNTDEHRQKYDKISGHR